MSVPNVLSRRGAALALLASLGLSACGQKPAEINVQPLRQTIYGVGKRKPLTAEVVDKKNNPIPDARVKWDSAKPSVVTVDSAGFLKSVAPGKTTVSVVFRNVSATIPIEVIDVASVTITPNRVTLVGARGTSSQLTAEVKDSKGNILALNPKWNVGDEKIAKVDAGNVTALAEGRTTISASLDEVVGAADVRVLFREIYTFEMTPLTIILKPGETQKMSVTVRDASGATIEDPALLWSTSDPKTAVCSNGIIQAVGKGSATISAAVGNRVLSASVLVN
jgi:hypothetical protein